MPFCPTNCPKVPASYGCIGKEENIFTFMPPTSRSIVQYHRLSHHHHDEITSLPQLSQFTLHPPSSHSDPKYKIVSQAISYWASESQVISSHVIIQLLPQTQQTPSLSIRLSKLLNLARHLGPSPGLGRGSAHPVGSSRHPMRKYPTYPPIISTRVLPTSLIYSPPPPQEHVRKGKRVNPSTRN